MNTETISFVNWEKYQHYKDRNPPWIKLYHSLLDNYEYSCLQDDSKLLLLSLFMLAAMKNNAIPYDIQWIKHKAMIGGKPNLDELIRYGFIKINGNGSNVIATCKQNACLETETETETETDTRERKFDVFWDTYPKKVGKQAALKSFKKISAKLYDKIVQAVESQKNCKQWSIEGGRFIPNPATWLNQGRWDDEIESECKQEPTYL